MEHVPILMAFPDGALWYDCRSCDQRCCKAGGLSIFPREKEALLTRYPALDLVAPPASSAVEVYATPIQGCWFLQGENCSLHESDTWANNVKHTSPRPGACTLFPFNVFGSLGSALVIAPNGLCPLQVRAGEGMRHTVLLEQLEELGAAGLPPEQLRPEGDTLMPLEEAIIHASAQALGESTPLPFWSFVALATEAFVAGGASGLASADLNKLEHWMEQLDELMIQWCEILDMDMPELDAWTAVAPQLVAWGPSIRLFGFQHFSLEQLPHALTLLGLFAAHWQSMHMDLAVMPQTLMQHVSSMSPLVDLLVRWDEPWSGEDLEPWGIQHGKPISALANNLPTDSRTQRILFLRRAAKAMEGALE